MFGGWWKYWLPIFWGMSALGSIDTPSVPSPACPLAELSAVVESRAPVPRLEEVLARVRERVFARHPDLVSLDVREPSPGGTEKEIIVVVRDRATGRRREIGSLQCQIEDGALKLTYVGVDLEFRDLGINQLMTTFVAERFPRINEFTAALENTNAAVFVVGVSGRGRLRPLTRRYQTDPEYQEAVNARFASAFAAVKQGQSGVAFRERVLAAYENTPTARAYHGAGIRRLRSICVAIGGGRSPPITLSHVHTERGEASGEAPRLYFADSSRGGTTVFYELRADGTLVALPHSPH